MPDTTTILSLPLILPAQAQKHVTHNEALAKLDLIVQLSVINRTLTSAPALPAVGDRHIVAAGATGPWAGQSGKIALFAETGWQFTAPLLGWQAHVLAEGQTAVFDGVAWKVPSEAPFVASRVGVSATPDATNRLAVSSPATLLNHAGAGHQLKLNKATAGDTASLLFQTGFSGRAEMGTAGSDDFSVKVSADGSAYSTALVAAAATGQVTLPQPVRLGGQATDPSAPVNGTLWLNTTTGEVRLRSAGATMTLGGALADGDKGDVLVSGSGAVWTIDPGAVTLPKMADLATSTILGRATAGTGVPEALTAAQVRSLINVANGATANAADSALRDRATHTGSQIAATISDFATAVSTNAAVAANTAKVTNATHTGDVTGATALTIAANAVDNTKAADMASARIKGRVTAATGDPEDLTGTQATSLLDTVTSTLKGLAPASGGGVVNYLRADGTWAVPSGGGGVTDGDKGDITVSGTGTVWTVDPGAVTFAKMANVATSTILGRVTAATGVVEALTATQVRGLINVADGATANAADAALRDRTTHTGTQPASTVTGLAAIATSGSASDLAAGTLPAARFDDTAHGARAGGALHASVVAAGAAGFMTGADKTKLDGVAVSANNYVHPNHSGDVTSAGDGAATIAPGAVTLAKMANLAGSTILGNNTGAAAAPLALTVAQVKTLLAYTPADIGAATSAQANAIHTGDVTGATALTIAANAVDNTKAADMASARIKGRVTAATGDPEDLTGTQATTLLDTFTTSAKGLVPAPVTSNTTDFLRRDGTWAAPSGGGAPGGSSGQMQFNSAGAFGGAANVGIEASQFRLAAIAAPATPATGGINLYGTDIALNGVPGFIGPDGVVHAVQSDLGEFTMVRFAPQGGSNNLTGDNSLGLATAGTTTVAPIATTNLHAMMRRIDHLVLTAAVTAAAGLRGGTNFWRVGRSAAAPGGFLARIVWGPATGVATTTNRAFCGMRPTAAPTDVEPSSLLNIVGMGWDAADTNIQMMTNDGTGVATKIDLGASFPVPTVDRQEVYEMQLFSPNSLTQSVSYRVIRYNTTDKTIAAQTSGTLTTDLPVVTQLLVPTVQMSVGGTSSVIGVAVMGMLVATAY